MRNIFNVILVAGASFTVLPAAQATLVNGSTLTIEAGSFYTLNGVDDSPPTTVGSGSYLTGHNGLVLGTAQEASGSHAGTVDGSEVPGIDQAWEFFGNTGMHESKSPTNVLSAVGNSATVDFSGWGVDWNGTELAENTGAWFPGTTEGTAYVTCNFDCGDGDSYTLIYSASSCNDGTLTCFAPIKYYLELHGVVMGVVPPISADLAVTQYDNPDPILKSDTVTYSITVTNNGPYDASGVALTDMLPSDISFVSATSSQGSCAPITSPASNRKNAKLITVGVDCSLGYLASGSAAATNIVVQLNTEGSNTNTVSVASDINDTNLSNNFASEITTVEANGSKPCKGKSCSN